MKKSPNLTLDEIIDKHGLNLPDEGARVARIYDFVRNEIRFGYNASDNLTAKEVYADGFGQCNTKAALLFALLARTGTRARIRALYVHKSLQKGLIPALSYRFAPDKILHSWTEIFVGGKWVAAEGVILDEDYLRGLRAMFPGRTGPFCGYALSVGAFESLPPGFTGEDAFVQRGSVTDELGLFDSPDEMFAALSQTMGRFKGFVYRHFTRKAMNRRARKIRRLGIKARQAEKASV